VLMSMPHHSPPAAPRFVHSLMPTTSLSESDAEVAEHQRALSAVIGYIDTLRRVDLSGVDVSGAAAVHAAAGGDGSGSHLAADEPGETLPNSALMKMAPRTLPPFVLVPKVLDDGSGGGGA
jgi:aspartyl/glutamyl-tRNA(Asn/Gln) amidotransferase C subunit